MKECPQCSTSCYDSAAFCSSCGADLSKAAEVPGPEDPLKGRTFADKYLLLERVGEGGMGAVYKAEHTVLEKTIAVKILHRAFLADESAVERFRHEARAASRMNHPNSISVIDFGETPDGLFYIVTEFLRGRPLGDHLDQHGAVELTLATEVMRQVLAAMEEAESLGIVHRDLKPENIFVEKLVDGSWLVKVLDFGIAKRVDAAATALTTPGMVCGTPEYMAPEQARGEQVDHRADIYALGVIWYEMLTGTNPFERDSVAETLLAHIQHEPKPPSAMAPDRNLPESLDALVLWAMSRNRDDRYATVGAFREALEAWSEVNLAQDEEDLPDQPVELAKIPPEPAGPPQEQVVPPPTKAPVPEGTADLFAFTPKKVPAAVEPGSAKDVLERSLGTDDTLAAADAADLAIPPPVFKPGELVGRREQLEKANQAVQRGGFACVSGEPGIGKSAVLTSVVRTAEDRGFRVIRVGLSGPASGRPMSGPRSAVRQLMELGDRDLSLEGLVRSMERLSIPDEEKKGLSDLLEVADPTHEPLSPAGRARERAAAFRSVLAACGRGFPTLLAVEDVDLMDEPSRALFSGLAQFLSGSGQSKPVCVMVTAADENKIQASQAVQIPLGPIPDGDVRVLSARLTGLLGTGRLLDSQLVQTGGNPFFVDQMARLAAEGGPSHTLNRRMDLVDMRLERVSGLPRQILQMAAVRADGFGPDQMAKDLYELKELIRAETAASGFEAAVRPATDDLPAAQTEAFRKLKNQMAADLEKLRRNGFVVRDNGSWSLAHRIFEQAIEAGMPAEVRRMHHLVYFRRREPEFLTDSAPSSASWVARHAVEAEEERPAVQALQAAGCCASWNQDHDGAVRFFYQAFDRVRRLWAAGGVGEPGLTDDMVAVARQLGLAMSGTGQGESASFLFREILGLLAEDERHLRAALLLDLGRQSMETGRVEPAVEELERALKEARHIDAHWLTGEVLGQLAQARARRGDLNGAVEHLKEGIRISSRSGGGGAEHVCQFNHMLGQLVSASGKTDEAYAYLESGLESARKAKKLSSQIDLREAAARTLKQARKLREAAIQLAEAAKAAVEWGDRGRAAEVCCITGELAAEMGDPATARVYLGRALKYSVDVELSKTAERARAGIARLGK